MTPLLRIADLRAGYRDTPVLEAVTLAVGHGESVALIGPNGCGKSTLVASIAGTLPGTSGIIHFRDRLLSGLPPERRVEAGIGYLKQAHNVFPSLSVKENLLLAGDSAAAAERRTAELLTCFPMLARKLMFRAGLLSGGERQALALAMILSRGCRLLLLDEPVAGLSQASARSLLAAVSHWQERVGFAVLMIEHRLRLIHPHVDRVIVMVRGAIAEDTKDVSLLLDRPRLERHYLL